MVMFYTERVSRGEEEEEEGEVCIARFLHARARERGLWRRGITKY